VRTASFDVVAARTGVRAALSSLDCLAARIVIAARDARRARPARARVRVATSSLPIPAAVSLIGVVLRIVTPSR
jgi:hypothetical protein